MSNSLCAAIGDFDGVHLGHAAVINTAVNNCKNHIPSVYTFTDNCKKASIITDNRTKEIIIKSMGIKNIIFDDFEKIKDLTPLSFVRDILQKKHNICSVVCGNDFRFGKNAEGDVELLKDICYNLGIELKIVDCLHNNGRKISSTDIRKFIQNGDVDKALALLGHPFYVNGDVSHGKKLGHTQNTPTVNISFNKNGVVPAYGVYLTKTKIDGVFYNSISNVGVRPSVESTNIPNVETNIFDFDRDIYGQNITVGFIKRIRPEIKFDNKTKLFEQIQKDIAYAKDYFNGVINE